MAKRRIPVATTTSRSFERDAAAAAISLDELLRDMKAQGFTAAEISTALSDSFDAGQGPFAQFQKMAKQSVAGLTSQRVSIETARQLSEGDGTALGVWMSTGGSNVCPGCAKLHGEKMTADEFERKHGTNECGANCYCFWMPGETPQAGAFAIRSVMAEHPEWFRNSDGVQPPELIASRMTSTRKGNRT